MSRPSGRRGPFRRALSQMRQDLWLQVTAVSSLSVALAIVGAYLTLCFNVQGAMDRVSTGAALMVVLEDKTTKAQGVTLAARLAARPEVDSAEYIGKAQALERFRKQLGPHAGLLQGLDANPLPKAIEARMRPGGEADPAFIKQLEKQPLVQEVVTSRPWLHQLEKAGGVLGEVAMALGLLLFLGVVFLVTNTMRLAVYVRRDQLEIMELVGASGGYMRRPFLWEAVIQALAASLIASALVGGVFKVLGAPAALPLGLDMRDFLVLPRMVPPILALMSLAAGLLGGFLGVGRALRPQGW